MLLQGVFPDVRYPDRELEVIEGYPPQLNEQADFCTFADRCPWAVEECTQSAPTLESVDGEGQKDGPFDCEHEVACVRKRETQQLNRQRKQEAKAPIEGKQPAAGEGQQ